MVTEHFAHPAGIGLSPSSHAPPEKVPAEDVMVGRVYESGGSKYFSADLGYHHDSYFDQDYNHLDSALFASGRFSERPPSSQHFPSDHLSDFINNLNNLGTVVHPYQCVILKSLFD